MKQRLAERDAVIQELKRELKAPGEATDVAVPVPTAAAAGSAPEVAEKEILTPKVEPWGVYDLGSVSFRELK